ncbi:MAG TPA: hypothetical protein VEX39_16380 [Thermoleophilaceae bacterium]|nr:hypothetical protein [Thermoleophilaceae bacterium]
MLLRTAGLIVCVVASVLCVGLGPAAATSPQAARSCGSFVDFGQEGLTVEITRFRVSATRVSCRRAYRYGVALWRTNRRPRGWVCGSSHFEAGCSKGRRRITVNARGALQRECQASGDFYSVVGTGATQAYRMSCARSYSVLLDWARRGKPRSGPAGFRCRRREEGMDEPGGTTLFLCRGRISYLWFRIGG